MRKCESEHVKRQIIRDLMCHVLFPDVKKKECQTQSNVRYSHVKSYVSCVEIVQFTFNTHQFHM